MSENARVKRRNETTVGMFVVIAFILLTVSIFFISGVYFFRSGYTLSVIYNYVSILGHPEEIEKAYEAIIQLIRGSKHANVYKYLEQHRPEPVLDLGLKIKIKK